MSSESDHRTGRLGANEQAIIDKAPKPLRPLVTALWRAKVRLQWTGWLQYAIPLIPAALLFVVAALLAVLGWSSAAGVFALVGAALVLIDAFDIVTVKYGIHPAERLPEPRHDATVFDLVRARHSCRSFQRRVLTDTDREAVLESARRHLAAPRLTEAPIRLEYVAAPVTVWPTVNAGEFLIAIAPKQYAHANVMDVGFTLQRVVLDATARGLGTCWIGPGADQDSMAAALGDRFDPRRDHIICLAAIGYRSAYLPLFIRIFNARTSSTRKDTSRLFFTDGAMQHPLDVDAEPYASLGRTYEVCQWSPSSYNGQTTRGVVTADDQQVTQIDFYAVTRSRYYAMIAVGIWASNWDLGTRATGHPGWFESGTGVVSGTGPYRRLTWSVSAA